MSQTNEDIKLTPAEIRRIQKERQQQEKKTEWAKRLGRLIDEMKADGCNVSIRNLQAQGINMMVNPNAVKISFIIIDVPPVPLPQEEVEEEDVEAEVEKAEAQE